MQSNEELLERNGLISDMIISFNSGTYLDGAVVLKEFQKLEEANISLIEEGNLTMKNKVITPENKLAVHVAHFMYTTNGLDKAMIGEFLGSKKEENRKICIQYF